MNEQRLKEIENWYEGCYSDDDNAEYAFAEFAVRDLLAEVKRLKSELHLAAKVLVRQDIITRSRGAEICGMGWGEFDDSLLEDDAD